MVKYLMSFILLTLLALENHSIHNRLHAASHPNGEDTEAILDYIRQTQNANQDTNHKMHRHEHQKHHKVRTQMQPQPEHQQHPNRHYKRHAPPVDDSYESSNDDEYQKAIDDFRFYERVQRHLRHQLEHKQLHQAQHERAMNLRRMPRIWQHLLDNYSDESMYGDDPIALISNDEDDSIEERLHKRENFEEIEIPHETKNSFEDQTAIDELRNFEEIDNDKGEPETVEVRSNNSLESSESSAGAPTVPHGCPKCESKRAVAHISEEELTQLRIEFVKQQILEKLRLKERPNVSAVGLPKPIYEGTTSEIDDEQTKTKELDDYYARTSKKFIILQRENNECQRVGVHPSICFSFKIDDADADGFDVNTAVLWIFKNKQRTHGSRFNNTMLNKQTIVVSEVQQPLDREYLPMVKTIAIQTIDVQDEWMKIDIEWPIKRWFGNHDLSHMIHISCQSCDIKSMDEMISVDKDYRPFIMVNTQNRRRSSRQKRGINCSDGVTECCREKLYISFDEIGWGDWIIQPRGYDAYFCRGTCASVASVAQSSSHHSTFLSKLLSTRRGHAGKPLELVPCCTAKQYSSLQLVFLDSNNTATQKTFPNMVVESCGCR